jgi:transposase
MYADALSIFLEEISNRHPNDYILMIMDGAPCHRSGILKIPKNIEILNLPPYSPQLNPQENIWEEMREKWFGNTVFRDMEAVKQRMVEALLILENDPKRIKSITGWQWILNAIK